MNSRWYQSITFQLTALFSVSSTAVLLLLGLLIWTSVERHFVDLDVEMLSGKLVLAQRAVEKINTPAQLAELPQRLDDALSGHHGFSVMVVASDGQTLYATDGVAFPPELSRRTTASEPHQPMVWQTKDGRPMRGIAAPAFTGVADLPPTMVAIGTDISLHEHFKHSFQITLWLFVLLAACMSGILGWVAARRGLAPFIAIKSKAADITAHELHARLPIDAVPVELRDLVETLNDMLARLEDSFKKLSDFSSDIAHELRTPVSNLLTQTQVMLSRERTPDEYRDVLASNIEEFERLSRMVSDMLFLAKSDNRLMIPRPEQLDLQIEVNDLCEFYEALAEEKSIVLTCSGRGHVSGDRLMLRRAISNLLSNALRHTPPGGSIAIDLDDTAESLVKLSVENSGETIPADHLPRLFDRFYRADASRHNLAEGAGLGLAITQSIARAHGGDISVRSSAGRTKFELTLPSQLLL